MNKVVFTGGAATGKGIAELAAANLTPALLELGGKSPNIVFADASIPNAVNGCIAGIFAASGQTCLAGSRLFLHDKIHDEFVERLKDANRTIRLGDPSMMESEMGPMATLDQLHKVESFVEAPSRKGRSWSMAERPEDPPWEGAGFSCPPFSTACATTCALHRKRFSGRCSPSSVPGGRGSDRPGERDAIRPCGRHLDKRRQTGPPGGEGLEGGHRLDQHVSSPLVCLPLRRLKQSGYGREMGAGSHQEFTQVKSVWVDLAETVPDPFVIR